MKLIDSKNLAPRPFTISTFVSFLYLWERFPQEWFRTVLIILYAFVIVGSLLVVWNGESVDIFKDDQPPVAK